MKGPFEKTVSLPYTGGGRQVLRYQKWYRTSDGQKTRTPLPYIVRHAFLVKAARNQYNDAPNANCAYYAGSQWGRSGIFGNTIQNVHNRAYAKWLEKVTTSAAIGVDLAEYKQTLSMIHSTLKVLRRPLLTFGKAVRDYSRLGVGGSAKKLLLKDMPNAWLTFHFGVEPLIKDLHDLCERLDQIGRNQKRICSVARAGKWEYIDVQGANKWSTKERYHAICRISATVQMTNPSTALLNDLGLLNPLSIAWELVPFSFVVDWFYPIGSYLQQCTDLVGYTVTNPYRTWYLRYYGYQRYWDSGAPYTEKEWQEVSGYRLERVLESPSLKLKKFKLPESLSPVRAATAISLLLLALNKTQSQHPLRR